MPRKRSAIGVRTPAARRMAARAARGQSSRTLENPQQSQARLQEATILTGCFQNEEVFISRIPLIHDDKHSPLHFKRLQFPIRVSFAMSINNAQEATILTGCFQNEEVFIPRIPLIHDDKHSPLHFKRLQFPIRVSFAMSINKAQGQSLKIAGIDLEQPCFSHGQLYVACSRLEATENPVKNGKVHEAANHVENGSRHFELASRMKLLHWWCRVAAVTGACLRREEHPQPPLLTPEICPTPSQARASPTSTFDPGDLSCSLASPNPVVLAGKDCRGHFWGLHKVTHRINGKLVDNEVDFEHSSL
ncbi:KLHDC10 [Cordylochernes scorpioides]|uniref:KLHDC10 n=1 Tax=Cordylochernes scorpioides TaxID=51811 RepID=A0ABY6LIK5_9ARAC|nr:KLHDC10 [Cordylochernes scorpioides]